MKEKELEVIAGQLINWYKQYKRDLPWRSTIDPYKIWISEIILQQTRVQQGLPYYEKFLNAYPTVQDLANASQQDVLRLWQGLGYYSRARNMHACAVEIVEKYGGKFPQTYEELKKLRGVGRYTAAAIASFAFNQPVPVIDGNVYRVLSRLFGETTDIASSGAYRKFFDLAHALIDTKQPDIFNQAIMEFGALHCTPQKPLCMYCPFQTICYANLHQEQENLPVKLKKLKARNRYFHYFVLETADGQLLMKQRSKKDIWTGLYDFYLVEADGFIDPTEIDDPFLQEVMKKGSVLEQESSIYKHQLSHQTLYVKFYQLKADSSLLEDKNKYLKDYGQYSISDVDNLPKPILIQNFLKEYVF